jgi:glycosyltransferase involved in cell wall biosynthesis
VIPALNEAEGIGPTLDSLPEEELEDLGYNLEKVVVDGESTDGTRDIARDHGARVVVEPRPGYGRAYKTGFQAAEGEVLVTGDADTTYPLETTHELLQRLEDGDLDFITTNRFADLQEGAMRPKHRLGNWVLSATARLLFFISVRDSQSGMWVFRSAILDDLELTADGMPYSEEIKIEAFRHPDVEAVEVPIQYRPRVGEVKISSTQDGFRNLVFLFQKRFGLLEPPHEDEAELTG